MNSILDLIGNTPLLKIKKINNQAKANIFVKIEGTNPTGSIKDRVALAMIEKAERKGILRKGKTIIEPTSGNTGISLAMIGTVKGYKVKIVMPDSMLATKRKIIRFFGADLILIKERDWRDGAIRFTKQLVRTDSNLVMLNQYENNANVKTHYQNTAREIIKQMGNKRIDFFVAGIGTGGTITGIGKRLKKKYPNIKIIGIQPKIGSKIEGLKSLKEGYVPPILDLNVIDEIIEVDEQKAISWQKKLAKEEGILAGYSSGAAIYIAQKIAKKTKKGNIVTIFPDRGEKYL